MRLAGNGQRPARPARRAANPQICCDAAPPGKRSLRLGQPFLPYISATFGQRMVACDDAAASRARTGRPARELQYRRPRPRRSAGARAGARAASGRGGRRGHRRRGPAAAGRRDLQEAFGRVPADRDRAVPGAAQGRLRPALFELLPQHHRPGIGPRLRRPRADEFRRRRAADGRSPSCGAGTASLPPSSPTGSTSCRRRSSSISPPPRRSFCSACATPPRRGVR